MFGHRLGEFSVTKRLGHRGQIILRKKKILEKNNMGHVINPIAMRIG